MTDAWERLPARKPSPLEAARAGDLELLNEWELVYLATSTIRPRDGDFLLADGAFHPVEILCWCKPLRVVWETEDRWTPLEVVTDIDGQILEWGHEPWEEGFQPWVRQAYPGIVPKVTA